MSEISTLKEKIRRLEKEARIMRSKLCSCNNYTKKLKDAGDRVNDYCMDSESSKNWITIRGQKCGEQIGWLGRLLWFIHKCKREVKP